ncbi:MAG: OmpA family protein [Treponema sp.]
MKKTYKTRFYSNYENVITLKNNKLPILFFRGENECLHGKFNIYSKEIKELIQELEKIKDYYQYFISEELELSDIALAVLFGACGSFITNSEKLKEFFRLFHDESSEANVFQRNLQKFLSHKDNPIDYDKNKKFINRNGGTPKFGFHRLFYGHDILSFKGDNPFQLYAEKFGFLNGTAEAVKHLFADSCSKQGLPPIGSSLFDMKSGDDFTNLLYELAKKVGKNSSEKTQLAFQNLFAYHFQDSLGSCSSEVLSNIYLKARDFETDKAKNIFMIIVNISEFIVNAITGLIKTAGMTLKINWCNVIRLFYQIGKFVGIKIKEHKIKKIEDNYNKQVIILEECKKRIYIIYKINYVIDFVILLLLLFFIIYFVNIKINKNQIKNIVTNNIDDISLESEVSTSYIITEKKSLKFRADRRDFEDYDDAIIWCNEMAKEIQNRLSISPDEKFLITGYVAEFNNEIDGEKLSLERAMNVRKELIKLGIPEDSLQVKSGGATNRWGTERRNNRVVTIESIVE